MHPAEEQDRRHQRGIAAHRIAEDQRPQDEEPAIDQGDQRDPEPDVGGDTERHLAEGGDAFQREIPQPPVVPAGAPGVAPGAPVADRGRREADPDEHPLHEAPPFRHLAQRVESRAGEQAEVSGVLRDLDGAQPVDDPVEQMGRACLEPAFALPRLAHGMDHVEALAPLGDQGRDQLGRVLQIGVERDHDIAPRLIQPRRQRRLLAEIARQVVDAKPGVGSLQADQTRQRPILAAVVDADEFPRETGAIEHRDQPVMQRLEIGFLVVAGNDDRDEQPQGPSGGRGLARR